MPEIPTNVLYAQLRSGAQTRWAEEGRRSAAAALAARGKSGRRLLLMALRDSQKSVRNAAAEVLYESGNSVAFRQALVELMLQGHHGQKVTAVEWLLRYADPPLILLSALFEWVLSIHSRKLTHGRRREKKLSDLIAKFSAPAIHQEALRQLEQFAPGDASKIACILEILRRKNAVCSPALKKRLEVMGHWSYPGWPRLPQAIHTVQLGHWPSTSKTPRHVPLRTKRFYSRGRVKVGFRL